MQGKQWYNPIEQLKPGIHSLMNYLNSQLKLDLQEEINKANRQFVYDSAFLPIKTPKSELNIHRIAFQDINLSFLSCCSYIPLV